jgi:hypothetical protein
LYRPPPNPAKLTDSRIGTYRATHGTSSWELDALDPAVLAAVIRDEIEGLIDQVTWRTATAEETQARRDL